MKPLSHKRISIIIATISAIITIGALFVLLYSIDEYKISYIFFVGLLVFITIYIISFYITKEYIIQKVKPMYKVIQSTKGNPINQANKDLEDDFNILATTEQDLLDWAKSNRVQIEELKRLEKYRKEYIGNVAHELKTPIFSIQGYIATLIDGGIDDPSINVKYLERADKAITRMTSIIRDLDAITRLESGELTPEKAPFDLTTLIKEVFEAQEFLANQRSVSLIFEEGLHKKVMVYADRKYISMVFSNLVINAIKYNKTEGGKVNVRFYDMDNLLLIEVADTGIGMGQLELNRIFERFYRVDKSRSREQGGTGLGLSIVKHIIEAHEQTIHVKSLINKGSSFTFTLEKAK